MQVYNRVILSTICVFAFTLLCGCGKKQNAPSTPQPLVICISNSPVAFSHIQYSEVCASFAGLGITLQSGQAGPHAAPNEMFIYHQQRFNAREGGHFESNQEIYVAEATIYSWLEWQENDQVIRRAVAATCAHEIGHFFLGVGFGVHQDDDTNVMNNVLDDWLPRLRQGLPPTFNSSQRGTIRKKLGYP